MPEAPNLPPIAAQPLSVLLLADSDRPELESGLRDWLKFLDELGHEHEVLLVDDAAADRTAEMAGRFPGVRFLRDPLRRGTGAALRLGLREARHPLLFHAPCDGQFRPADLRLLLEEIDKVHLVSGYRVGRSVPLWMRCLGLLWRLLLRVVFGMSVERLTAWLGWRWYAHNLVARTLFGVRLRDVECAFRLFRREIFRRIPIQSDGSFALIEVLAKANFATAVMSEVAVPHQAAAASPPLSPAERRRWRKELWQVFTHPDFGPPILPEEQPLPKTPPATGEPCPVSAAGQSSEQAPAG
jgi:glycosyltransferase involved in cell wall biosynthesis